MEIVYRYFVGERAASVVFAKTLYLFEISGYLQDFDGCFGLGLKFKGVSHQKHNCNFPLLTVHLERAVVKNVSNYWEGVQPNADNL